MNQPTHQIGVKGRGRSDRDAVRQDNLDRDERRIASPEMLPETKFGEAEMRRVSMVTRDEIVAALRRRYVSSGRVDRNRILDEFAAVTGFHRKHAMRLLRQERPASKRERLDRRLYDDATREALVMLWEASDRICSRRLKVLIPFLLDAMERHGHALPSPDVRTKLTAISAAMIDRALDRKNVRPPARRKASIPAVRQSIPI